MADQSKKRKLENSLSEDVDKKSAETLANLGTSLGAKVPTNISNSSSSAAASTATAVPDIKVDVKVNTAEKSELEKIEEKYRQLEAKKKEFFEKAEDYTNDLKSVLGHLARNDSKDDRLGKLASDNVEFRTKVTHMLDGLKSHLSSLARTMFICGGQYYSYTVGDKIQFRTPRGCCNGWIDQIIGNRYAEKPVIYVIRSYNIGQDYVGWEDLSPFPKEATSNY